MELPRNRPRRSPDIGTARVLSLAILALSASAIGSRFFTNDTKFSAELRSKLSLDKAEKSSPLNPPLLCAQSLKSRDCTGKIIKGRTGGAAACGVGVALFCPVAALTTGETLVFGCPVAATLAAAGCGWAAGAVVEVWCGASGGQSTKQTLAAPTVSHSSDDGFRPGRTQADFMEAMRRAREESGQRYNRKYAQSVSWRLAKSGNCDPNEYVQLTQKLEAAKKRAADPENPDLLRECRLPEGAAAASREICDSWRELKDLLNSLVDLRTRINQCFGISPTAKVGEGRNDDDNAHIRARNTTYAVFPRCRRLIHEECDQGGASTSQSAQACTVSNFQSSFRDLDKTISRFPSASR